MITRVRHERPQGARDERSVIGRPECDESQRRLARQWGQDRQLLRIRAGEYGVGRGGLPAGGYDESGRAGVYDAARRHFRLPDP